MANLPDGRLYTGSFVITPETFPTPSRMDSFTTEAGISVDDKALLAERGKFSLLQAQIANIFLAKLVESGDGATLFSFWEDMYVDISRARYHLPVNTTVGGGVVSDPGRMWRPISDNRPNIDSIGEINLLCAGPDKKFDPELKIFVGGFETPAYRTKRDAGLRAARRFERPAADYERISEDGDLLQNIVHPFLNDPIDGNRIAKGSLADKMSDDIFAILRDRGDDVSLYESGRAGRIYVTTAPEAQRGTVVKWDSSLTTVERTRPEEGTILHDTLTQLTRMSPRDATPRQLAQIAYQLYQSPQFEKGSDASIRIFIGVISTHFLGKPPIIREDIDYCGMVDRQSDFIRKITTNFDAS